MTLLRGKSTMGAITNIGAVIAAFFFIVLSALRMQPGLPRGEENRAAGGVGPAAMGLRHGEVAVRFFLFFFIFATSQEK